MANNEGQKNESNIINQYQKAYNSLKNYVRKLEKVNNVKAPAPNIND